MSYKSLLGAPLKCLCHLVTVLPPPTRNLSSACQTPTASCALGSPLSSPGSSPHKLDPGCLPGALRTPKVRNESALFRVRSQTTTWESVYVHLVHGTLGDEIEARETGFPGRQELPPLGAAPLGRKRWADQQGGRPSSVRPGCRGPWNREEAWAGGLGPSPAVVG